MKRAGVWTFFAILPWLFVGTISGTEGLQVRVLPGSVGGGQRVLQEKGCLNCHALDGTGGDAAPDFAELPRRGVSPDALAAAMWNHGPAMWREFAARKLPVPAVSAEEAADLFAFFYATLYFEPVGDGARGNAVFVEKGCVGCHSEVLGGGGNGIARDRLAWWGTFRDPMSWAQAMWNHAGNMSAAMTNRGIAWPRLSQQDVADLGAFFTGLSAAAPAPSQFAMGDPQLGRTSFDSACASCHIWGPGAGLDAGKVDLLERAASRDLTGFVAAMWNHAPAMLARGAANTAGLRTGEMGDLVAFLFSQQYFFEKGSVENGARVYEAKGCVECHGARRMAIGAPDLASSPDVYSPIVLTAVLFRHGPAMLETMSRMGIAWPEFEDAEMADLAAYLNSRLTLRIAQ